MEYTWKATPSPDIRKIESLSNLLNNPPKSIVKLLLQRGVKTLDEARKFFAPEIGDLHDPFLMKDMQEAVDRILSAENNNEKVLVYGDYDVDGTTSVAIVYSFLKNIFPDDFLEFYIPDRYTEGYGISKKGIDWAKGNNFTLIIALDCGTTSLELIAYAKSIGIDFIVCDHHLPGEELPETIALLNPKQPECTYPYKELSGCGIGFKLIQAIAKTKEIDSSKVFEHIDLVSVSIASDIVNMMGENRTLMFLGIEKLNKNPNIGLQALMVGYKDAGQYEVNDIVFGLGPRINAAGRISHASDSVNLLIEKNFHKAVEMAKLLNQHNTERKDYDSEITEKAKNIILNNSELKSKYTTVLKGFEWHKGVIGIVASRLIEDFYKPTIIFSENDGILTGSARSVRNFDIHNAISQCSEFVVQFGGHTVAAGLTVKAENFEAFSNKFEEVVRNTIDENSLKPMIEYDLEIDFDEINNKFMNLLDRFKPYGPGNLRPVFLTKKIKDTGYSRLLKDKHIKISAVNSNVKMEGIGFNMPEKMDCVKNGDTFECCYSLEWNEFRNQKKLQMIIKDIKACS